MKKLAFLSVLLRLALVLVGAGALVGALIGTRLGFTENYWGWSAHLFWRLTAHLATLGVWVGLGLAALTITQALILRLFLAPKRAFAALACGWLATLPALAALPLLLRAMLQNTPAAKMPLFAADAASMQIFIGRILAGALLPDRLPSLLLMQPLVIVPPLLVPLVFGLLVYFIFRRPLARRLDRDTPRPRHWLRWVILLVVSAAAVIGPTMAARQTRPAASTPNLLLISIDTLRADALSVYGARTTAAPRLDDLAAHGVRFAATRAPASWTLPSHAALLTGRWPWRLGVRRVADALPRAATTLAEALAARGYDTHAVVTHLFVDTPYGFGQGYDEVEHPNSERAADAAALAVRWLRQREPGAPYFLFLHLYDPHWPYDPKGEIPSALLRDSTLRDRVRVQDYTNFFDLVQALRQGPPGLARAARALYLGEVYAADRAAGQVIDLARQDNRPTVIAVVSDHGDLFGEHGTYGHGITLFEPEIRVPWILAGPDLPAGVAREGAVSLIDVAPTVLGLLGIPGALPQTDGLDLSAVARGAAAVPEQRWIGGENLFVSAQPARYVTDNRWKWFGGVEAQVKLLHLAFAPLLTRVDLDPTELTNVLDEAMAAQIEAVVRDLFSGVGRSDRAVTLTDEEKKRLQSLGYLPSQ